MTGSLVTDDGQQCPMTGRLVPASGHFLWFDGQQCPMTGIFCGLTVNNAR